MNAFLFKKQMMVKHWVQKKIHENQVQADDNLPLNKKIKDP